MSPCRKAHAPATTSHPPATRADAGFPWFIDALFVGGLAGGLFLFGWLLLTKSIALGLLHCGHPADARVSAKWVEDGYGGRAEEWVAYEYDVPGAGTFTGKLQVLTETYRSVSVGGSLPVRYFAAAPDVSGKPDEQASPLWFDAVLLAVLVAVIAWFLASPFTESRVPVPGIVRRALRRRTPAPPR